MQGDDDGEGSATFVFAGSRAPLAHCGPQSGPLQKRGAFLLLGEFACSLKRGAVRVRGDRRTTHDRHCVCLFALKGDWHEADRTCSGGRCGLLGPEAPEPRSFPLCQ